MKSYKSLIRLTLRCQQYSFNGRPKFNCEVQTIRVIYIRADNFSGNNTMTLPRIALFLFVESLFIAGCNSTSGKAESSINSSENSIASKVIKYKTSNPNLEPTMTLGGVLEVRTTNGGPVVLQSQVEDQRKAKQRQDAESKASQ